MIDGVSPQADRTDTDHDIVVQVPRVVTNRQPPGRDVGWVNEE
jgi:hypothetical protein